jgi:hypothetical protein
MKIAIQVFIQDFSRYYTEGSWETQKFWDTYGASNAIDNDVTGFSASSFVRPSKPTNGYVVEGAKAKGYFWTVAVASFAERESLNITQFPAIRFFDVDANKYVESLDGTPRRSGEVANVLKLIFSKHTGGGVENGITTAQKKKVGFGLAALALLFLVKKPIKRPSKRARK